MSYLKINNTTTINYVDPQMSQIHIKDIARGLAKECRYNGHCAGFYSVAQHSVIGAEELLASHDKYFALEFLLHDATEAYMKDLPRTLKELLPQYQALETLLDKQIRCRFGLPAEMSEIVAYMDQRMLATEMRDLRGDTREEIEQWSNYAEPLSQELHGWDPAYAEGAFMSLFTRLTV